LVRYGTSLKWYKNGILDNSTTNDVNVVDNTGNLNIGKGDSWPTTYLTGYIDELRISKGIARWTSDFTPPTRQYSADSYTTLLLHCDGSVDGSLSITDSSLYTKTINRYGSTQIKNAVYKFGEGSCYFNGASQTDYLSVAASSDWAFGTGDFTVDCWVYITNLNPGSTYYYDQTIFSNLVDIKLACFLMHAGGAPAFYNGSAEYDSTLPVTLNAWTHVAFVRYSGVLYMFTNGIIGYSGAMTTNFTNSSSAYYIGGMGGSNYRYVYGYIDELRVSKGIARWTSNFNPYNEVYYLSTPASYTYGRRNRLSTKSVSTYNQLL